MNKYKIQTFQIKFLNVLIILILSTLFISESPPKNNSSGDTLFNNFQNPPESAGPRTWWHWTGGNVTLEGITKDLEWMHRIGIAGFQLADVSFGSGQTVDDKILFATPAWLDALHHAAQEADRLNLEMAIFSSAGWSLTGGPWVKPEQAMKKLVWSDTLIHGPRIFSGKLPHPPFNNGPIRNLGFGSEPNQQLDPTFYGDVAVLAYRLPASES
ncbi:MAG: glycosyl hydrolase, partial [Calditrichaceae bacterium]